MQTSSLTPTLTLSLSSLDEGQAAAPALPLSEPPLERITLGSLQTFPIEIILLCLSHLSAFHLLRFSRVNRACRQLSQTPSFWKDLILKNFPIVVPFSSEPNWKMFYRQHDRYERNFILFRKRACSRVTSLRPSHERLQRSGAFVLLMKKYYFSFDIQGNLRAICDEKTSQRIYNIHGKIERIREKDWQAEANINKEFIELVAVDGAYPFPPEVKFHIISHLNSEQRQAIQYLQGRTRDWMERMTEVPDLDQRVEKALKSTHASRICCVRGNELVTPWHKAYFIFFQVLLETPLLQRLSEAESNPPFKRVRMANLSPDD